MTAPVTLSPTGTAAPTDGTVLYWRARAVNSHTGATSEWTPTQVFVVGPAPTAAGTFTVTEDGKITGEYINAWNGTAWSPWTKVI